MKIHQLSVQDEIEVILFDLGNVILPFNHFQIAQKLSPSVQEKELQSPEKIFSYLFDPKEGKINDFDTGKISPQEFFQSVKKDLSLSLSYDEFIPIWNDIFIEDQEVSKIIHSLKGRWRLGLLSNTDPLHFDYILSKFPIVEVFERRILSYEVGFKKPALEIFQKAIEWAVVEPQKILLIDDIQEHIEVAISLGMQGIHFVSANQLKDALSLSLDFPFILPSEK